MGFCAEMTTCSHNPWVHLPLGIEISNYLSRHVARNYMPPGSEVWPMWHEWPAGCDRQEQGGFSSHSFSLPSDRARVLRPVSQLWWWDTRGQRGNNMLSTASWTEPVPILLWEREQSILSEPLDFRGSLLQPFSCALTCLETGARPSMLSNKSLKRVGLADRSCSREGGTTSCRLEIREPSLHHGQNVWQSSLTLATEPVILGEGMEKIQKERN